MPSDEVRIAREQIDQLMSEVVKPDWITTGYDRQTVRVLMILHELCGAVENIERWQSMLLELHKAQEPGPEGVYQGGGDWEFNAYPQQG